jgi:hypothetical protein
MAALISLLRRPLLSSVLLGLAAFSVAIADVKHDTVVSNAPEELAKLVFVGPDAQMPTDGSFLLSLNPTTDDAGSYVVPTSSEAALIEMRKMIPHWFQAALQHPAPGPNQNCLVYVNHDELTGLAEDWMVANWHLNSPSSPLRKELTLNGASKAPPDDVLFAGFCRYVETASLSEGLSRIDEVARATRGKN